MMAVPHLLPPESTAPPRGLRRWPPHLRLAAGLLTAAVAVALPTTAYGAQSACLGLLLLAGWTHGVGARTMALRLAPLLGAGLVVLALLVLLGSVGLYPAGLPTGSVFRAPPVAARLALWSLLSKTGLAVLTFTVLTGLLSPGESLVAMRRLGVPRTMRVVTYLALHWLREISEQAQSLRRAAISRGQPHGYRRLFLALSLGRSLMLRCVQRADTIAFALYARGFTGDLPVIDSHAPAPEAAWSFATYCLVLGTISWLARWR